MRRWLLIAVLATSVVAPNALAWAQARAVTRFTSTGARTPPPERLGWRARASTLLFGVSIPKPHANRAPEDVGLSASTSVLPGPIGDLSVWTLGSGPTVVVLVHGYAGERSQLLRTARRLVDLGYTVVAPDLRGCGESAGDATTLGWGEAEDVAAVVRWVGTTLDDDRPVLYGFSMGGAAVVGAAGRLGVPARAVVTEAAFDRLVTTVGHRFEAVGMPPRGPADLLLFWGGVQTGINPYRVAPVDDARGIDVPTLIVGGALDRRVLPAETRALATAAHAELALLDGVGHQPLANAHPEDWDRVIGGFLLKNAPPER